METFKTPKGTTLPLLDLRGKKYLQVAHRIQWFREDHNDWGIETEVKQEADSATARCIVRNSAGIIIATATKYEDRKGFPDFIEKAETGAIGRALALCGYGTQFTTELEEGERLADSPIAAHTVVRGKSHEGSAPLQPNPQSAFIPSVGSGPDDGQYRIPFGKHTQKTLEEVGASELRGYVEFLERSAKDSGKEPNNKIKDFIARAEKFVADFENSDVPF